VSEAESWTRRVEAHHAQSLKAQGNSGPPGDFWRPFASAFRSDPRRTDDPVLDSILRHVTTDSTALDVGGGAGRLALPLALRCTHVTVVEPSEAMVEELREAMREAAIENLSIVEGTWEEVEVDPTDVVLCAHVVYGVEDIEDFVRKLDSSAVKRVLILAFIESPQANLSPMWEPVHGQERVDLPALPELMGVLWEMGISPDLEMLDTGARGGFESWDVAIEQLRRRLYVAPDTEPDRRLQSAARELLVDTPDGLVVRGTPPRQQGLVSWRPE